MTWYEAYLVIGVFLGAGVAAKLIGLGTVWWKVILLSIVCVFTYPLAVGPVIWRMLHEDVGTQLQK